MLFVRLYVSAERYDTVLVGFCDRSGYQFAWAYMCRHIVPSREWEQPEVHRVHQLDHDASRQPSEREDIYNRPAPSFSM